MSKPARIIIEPHQVGWKMTIEAYDGSVLDYTLSSRRWMVWGMAKKSWSYLMRGGRFERGEKGTSAND
jgi:hypothetical protein